MANSNKEGMFLDADLATRLAELQVKQAETLLNQLIKQTDPELVVNAASQMLDGLAGLRPDWTDNQTDVSLLAFKSIVNTYAPPKRIEPKRPKLGEPSYVERITGDYVRVLGAPQFTYSPNVADLVPPLLTVGEILAPAIHIETPDSRRRLWIDINVTLGRLTYFHPYLKPNIENRTKNIGRIIDATTLNYS